MRLTGQYEIQSDVQTVWNHIFMENAFISIVPGCQQIIETSLGEYRGKMIMNIAAVKSSFDVCFKKIEEQAPYFCKFEGMIQGPTGEVKVKNSFTLQEVGEQTLLTYSADAQISGALHKMGAHFIESYAKSQVKLGLTNLAEEITNDHLEKKK